MSNRKLPPIYHYPIVERPRCSMDISSAETIKWRKLPDVARKLANRGVEQFGCGNMATYRIGEEWYCTKHAGIVALAMLSIDVPPGESP